VSVESRSSGGNYVARIDTATNEVISTVPVGGLPGQLAIEAGSLWIGLPGSVQRVDPETGRVISQINGPGTLLTATAGAVWALESANSIARIDPATNQVSATVSLDLPASGYIVSGPVATADAVWVMAFLGGDEQSGGSEGALYRISPNANSSVARIDLGMAGAFAVGDSSVWVVDGLTANGTSLARIATETNRVAAQIDIARQWTPFALGAGRLWLMGGIQPKILVAGLNLSTLELESSVVVADLPAFEGSGIFDSEGNALWIAQEQNAITKVELGQAVSNARSS
jgi:YVTN family beta-propeller protein